jgi:hypothetical protein
MTYKDFFKEYNMSQVPVGGQPSISGQSGTYASPDVTQNPGSFPADSSNVNIVPPVDQDIKSKIDPEQYKKDVEDVKTKVTPDDIIQGMQYELKKQIYKNKMVAKETVVQNLKENPRYYRDLGMLGMTPDMMNESVTGDINEKLELHRHTDEETGKQYIIVVSDLYKPYDPDQPESPDNNPDTTVKSSRAAGNETYKSKDGIKSLGFLWNPDRGWEKPYTTDEDLRYYMKAIEKINAGYSYNWKTKTWTPPKSGPIQYEELLHTFENLKVFVEREDFNKKRMLADKITSIINDLANAIEGASMSEAMKSFLNFKKKFWKYSFSNSLLIWSQKPNATQVAGLSKWKELGIKVNFETATRIKIWRPLKAKKDDSEVKPGEDTGLDDEIAKNNITRFVIGIVYDISDTNAAELGKIPQIPQWHDPNTPSETADKLYNYLIEFCQDKGIKVTTDPATGKEQGWASGDHINLTSTISGINRVSTLIHEIAHSLLHFKDSSVFYGNDETLKLTKEEAELQAESVAYTVTNHYGLDTKHGAAYISLWKGNKEAVQKNLTLIHKVATFIIKGVDQIAEEKSKETPMNENQKEKIGSIIRDMANQSKTRERVEQKYGNFEAIKKLMEEKWEEKKKRRNYGG